MQSTISYYIERQTVEIDGRKIVIPELSAIPFRMYSGRPSDAVKFYIEYAREYAGRGSLKPIPMLIKLREVAPRYGIELSEQELQQIEQTAYRTRVDVALAQAQSNAAKYDQTRQRSYVQMGSWWLDEATHAARKSGLDIEGDITEVSAIFRK